MTENHISLPTNRAFVIQLQANSDRSRFAHQGRVEHLSSGRAVHFPDEHELWAFIDSVLAAESPDQRKQEG